MKRVLITGGAGFIGSAVVNQLKSRDKYKIRIADNLSKESSRAIKKSNEVRGIEFYKVDLTDEREALKVMQGCEYVIHLAAKIGGIGYFQKYPATIISENNKINSSVFNAAVKNNVERIVYVSSSMVFESAKRFPSKEEDVCKIPPPKTAYGFSKLSGEYYCRAYNQEFGLNYTIIRPFNAYGINEYPGEEIGYAHVIPDLVKKILQEQYPLELLGDGKQIRCFTHVSDVANGIITAMEKKAGKNEDFNISGEEKIRMIDLAKRLWKLCNVKKPFKVKFVPGFEYDIKKRIPSVEKAKKLLGWEARVKLDDGLKEVVEWLRKEI
jgi:nucleoside-diphosphate-sugar epimerase